MAELRVDVVAADRAIWSGRARLVIARTGGGDIGVMPGHQPVLATLADGVVTVRSPDGDQLFAVHGGFISVAADVVSVLAETAERAEEIDVARAQAVLDRARAVGESEEGAAESAAAQRRAEIRLQAARGTQNAQGLAG